MHPHLLPHLMGGCVKHRAKRSLAFNAAGSAYASRVYGVAGNRKMFTIAGLVKRTGLAAGSHVVISAGGTDCIPFYFNGNKICVYDNAISGSYLLETAAFHRDPTAWLPFTLRVNTDEPVADNRIRLYTGLEQVTAFSTRNNPGLSASLTFNSATTHAIGRQSALGSNYFDGLLAELYVIDGQSLGPESFFELDGRSGNVRPKKWSGDFGLNGGYWPFIGDAGDAPATAAEGLKDRAPVSGGHVAANNWTPSGIVPADFVKDTPTNYRIGSDYRGNYATFSAVDSLGLSLSDGALKATPVGTQQHSILTQPVSGRVGFVSKGYVEFKNSQALDTGWYGLMLASAARTANPYTRIGSRSYRVFDGQKDAAGVASAYGVAAAANNDVVMMAWDLTAGKLWFGKNGAWLNGGDPVAGTNPAFSDLSQTDVYCIAYSAGSGTYGNPQLNCGQRSFAYTPPTGFKPLCTTAVSAPAKLKRSTAIGQAYDTAANIVAALATKRSTWGAAYIDVYKRTDGAEGFRWVFGDDPAFYLDTTDAAAAKQAFPALAGAQYAAATLHTGADYGITTGTVAHVNGVATLVADGQSTTRKFVFLRRTDAGGNWPASHPDCTAGKILYLNSTAGEAPAGDITAITSGGFSIGAGMPSGNYRWVSIAESAGAISLRKFDGNNSAAGPVAADAGAPGLHMLKLLSGGAGAGSWHTRIGIRNPSNPARNVVMLENTVQERTSDGSGNFEVDILATGIKLMNARSDNNGTAVYVTVSILDSVFATGECAAQGTAR